MKNNNSEYLKDKINFTKKLKHSKHYKNKWDETNEKHIRPVVWFLASDKKLLTVSIWVQWLDDPFYSKLNMVWYLQARLDEALHWSITCYKNT